MSRHLAAITIFAALLAGQGAYADTLAVSGADCRQLVTHVPQADVEYKPGVDVHGNAVAPADLGGGYQIKLPESVDIQIGVNLAHRLGVQSAATGASTDSTSSTAAASSTSATSSTTSPGTQRKPYSAYAPLGTVTIKGNQAYWNGEPIASQDQAALAEACRKGLGAAGVVLPTEKPTPP